MKRKSKFEFLLSIMWTNKEVKCMSIKGQGTGEKEGTWRQEWLDKKKSNREEKRLQASKDLQHTGIPPSASRLGKVNSPDNICTD